VTAQRVAADAAPVMPPVVVERGPEQDAVEAAQWYEDEAKVAESLVANPSNPSREDRVFAITARRHRLAACGLKRMAGFSALPQERTVSESASEDVAVAMLGDLIAAVQGFGIRSVRACVAEIYESLTDQEASETILNEICGPDA
jgi:hypothetical protein